MTYIILIIIVLIAIGYFLITHYTKKNLDETDERMRRGAIETHRYINESFEQHIQDLRANGVSEKRLREIRRERRLKDLPPLGPRRLFTINGKIITYEYAYSADPLMVEQKIAEIFRLNPYADITYYEHDLAIRIMSIEEPPSREPDHLKGDIEIGERE